MKKMRRVLLFLITLGFSISVFSCVDSNVTSSKNKLEAPQITLTENVITWENVLNADRYELTVGENTYTVVETTYSLTNLEAGSYGISVRAISDDSSYQKSSLSNVLTYEVLPNYSQISAPSISVTDKVISWSPVDGASSYTVYIGQSAYNTSESAFTIQGDFTGVVTIFVVAHTNLINMNDSLASNVLYYSKATGMASYINTSLLSAGSWDIDGTYQDVIEMVNNRQLYDTDLWASFVEQYRSNTDGDGYGWRGEFWGKMMEGASVTYGYTQDAKLYSILTTTVEDVLTTQQANGSISSYGSVANGDSDEFHGWDMWNRNWVMLGLEYYYNICKDDQLKARILDSLEKQLNWIMINVGPNEGQVGILDSASQWGGLPAATILEAVCKLYFMTGNERYLNFATYIVNEGGSKFGDQFEQAYLNETLPYQWGSPKAGELTMLFDGVLEYYFATGIEKYKIAAVNYWYDVAESELTVVGGGCSKDEVFEHSAIEQADPTKIGAMQEHCVTIHWLNFSKDVFQLLGDSKIIDSMEVTFYNAMYGAVDNEGRYDHAFTSYNGLMYAVRSTSAAGGMHLEEPHPFDYGCCISQGSIATGLLPQVQQSVIDGGFLENLYLPGTSVSTTENGTKVTFITDTQYPKDGVISITINPSESESFKVGFRIPEWSVQTTLTLNGQALTGVTAGEYYYIDRTWEAGDQVVLSLDMRLRTFYGSAEASNEYAQYNVALMRGPLTMARDARLDGGNIFQTLKLVTDEDGYVPYTVTSTASFSTQAEIAIVTEDGYTIHLVDYGSAGKTYTQASLYSVFFPTTDYWIDASEYETGVALVNVYYESIPMLNTKDQLIHMGNSYKDYTDLSQFGFKFVDAGNGYYYIEQLKSGLYFTLTNDKYFTLADYVGDDSQQFKLEHAGLMVYTIVAKNGYIVSANNETDAIWLYSNVGSTKQYWYLYTINTNTEE